MRVRKTHNIIIIFLFSSLYLALFSCVNQKNNEELSRYQINNINFLGDVWSKGQKESNVISQDGGYSNIISNGSLWWFGDTFLGKNIGVDKFDVTGNLSCSLAFLPKSKFESNLPPKLQYLCNEQGTAIQAIEYFSNESPKKIRLWPLSSIAVNNKYYVYYSYIEKTGNGIWDFKTLGTGLAVSDIAFAQYKRIVKDDHFLYPVSPVALVESNGWLYCYSIGKNGKGLTLSRVKAYKIEDKNAYEYYVGGGNFSKNRERQIQILDDVYGQISIAYIEYLDSYLMASSSSFFAPCEIQFFISKTAIGPWEKIDARLKVPEYTQGSKIELVYCAYFHPELFKDNGKVLNMTYSVMLKDRWFNVNNEMVEFNFDKLMDCNKK